MLKFYELLVLRAHKCFWNAPLVTGGARTGIGLLEYCGFNSLRPSDTIWRHRSGSKLAQVVACCLTAPSHYLNQCWLIMNFTGSAWEISSWYEFENYNFEITAPSPRGQWVNTIRVNTLSLEQNDQHCRWHFQMHFFKEKFGILS